MGCAVIAKLSGPSPWLFVGVCLEKKDGKIGREAGASSLPNRNSWGESVRVVELVLIGGLLKMGGNPLLMPVTRSA